jgi:hypothetical protein
MTTQQAILIGAVIIGVSIVGARAMAPYEFAPAAGADGNPFIWRANVMTGGVEVCPLIPGSGRVVAQCP